MRLPSKGIVFVAWCTRGSASIVRWPALQVALSGRTIQAKTTLSPGSRLNAIGNDVGLPSTTSSPQHSTTRSAPYSLNTRAASLA